MLRVPSLFACTTVLVAAAFGCPAGTLPCERDQTGACAGEEPEEVGGEAGGPSASGGGGGRAGAGGSSGAGGSPSASLDVPPDSTPVLDCQYGTVKDVEAKLLGGTDCTICHANPPLDPSALDLKTAGVRSRLLNVPASGRVCRGTKLIDTTDPAKSLLLIKVKGAKTPCPTGDGDSGDRMPTAPWTAAKVACLENYVNALAAAAKK